VRTEDLTHLHVLVTRPKPQGEILCEKLQKYGAHTVYLPTIEIIPTDRSILQRQLALLASYDVVIFVSPQAVYQSAPIILQYPQPAHMIAVGPGTAQALREYQLPAFFPEKDWNSEGLLAMPLFQDLKNKNVAIIKGEGGRELLTTELQKRGARVEIMTAYQRTLPQVNVAPIIEMLRKNIINMVISTSNEGLLNLKVLLAAAWLNLCEVPVLVISPRMKMKAHELGFKKILLANNASHDAVLDVLKKERIYD
jgi:uroporphyrinogen-III synthase